MLVTSQPKKDIEKNAGIACFVDIGIQYFEFKRNNKNNVFEFLRV